MSSCPLCNQSFDSALSNEFVVHVNGCLDLDEQQRMPKNFYVEDEAKLQPLIKKQKERQQAPDCVVCGKVKATAAHIKKCGKQYGVGTNQLIELIGKEQTANVTLQKIVLKDTHLDQEKVVNNLFTENSQNELTSARNLSKNDSKLADDHSSQAGYSKYFVRPPAAGPSQQNDFTIILDKSNAVSRNGTQTKLKVVRKSKTKNAAPKLADETVPLHESKKKRTVKLKRNPLAKVNLDDKIIQNYKDEYDVEKELPKSWRMANLSYDRSEYVVPGFEEFCTPFDFKDKMNGFEIGLENKK